VWAVDCILFCHSKDIDLSDDPVALPLKRKRISAEKHRDHEKTKISDSKKEISAQNSNSIENSDKKRRTRP
jgi:hypothetical protein